MCSKKSKIKLGATSLYVTTLAPESSDIQILRLIFISLIVDFATPHCPTQSHKHPPNPFTHSPTLHSISTFCPPIPRFGIIWTLVSILSSGFYMVMCGIVPHYFGALFADEIFGILNFAYAASVIFLSLIKPFLEMDTDIGNFLPFSIIGSCAFIGGLTCLAMPAKPLFLLKQLLPSHQRSTEALSTRLRQQRSL